jgi:hypothetical protein
MTKQHLLQEIKRTALANGGQPFGTIDLRPNEQMESGLISVLLT